MFLFYNQLILNKIFFTYFEVMAMNNWFEQECNREIIQAERKILEDKLAKMFGYYLLQLGGSAKADYLPYNTLANRIFLNPKCSAFENENSNINYVQAEYENLPFHTESIDVALVIHVLEFSPNPRAILKEVYHSLIYGGHMIIFGFNPISIFGLKKLLYKKKVDDPSLLSGRFINMWRVREWLVQTGFNDIESKIFKLGGCYMFAAQKKAVTVMPLQNKIRQRLPIRNFAVKPTPAASVEYDGK